MAEEWLEKLSTGSQMQRFQHTMGRYCGTFQERKMQYKLKIGFNKEPNNAILLETVDRLKVHIDKLKGNIQN